MKKLLFVLMLVICIMPVYGDMGPKPSLQIMVEGIDEVYVTVLTREEMAGPNRTLEDYDDIPSWNLEESEIEIYKKFIDFHYEDYNFWGNVQKLENNGIYKWDIIHQKPLK